MRKGLRQSFAQTSELDEERTSYDNQGISHAEKTTGAGQN